MSHTEVRPASKDDIAELVRLRALFETLGGNFFNPGGAGKSIPASGLGVRLKF
jgi:hypothetical protein